MTPPIGTPSLNYGFLFDRDGVDALVAAQGGMIDGSTYNTAGYYNVVLT